MILIKQLGISKFHVLGHHSGASIATEMAVLHPDQVLSLCISSPALLTPEEQEGFRKTELTPYNKPTRDGTHWSKSWDFINSENPWDLDQLQDLTLDATRAWQGRIQIYTCVFSQPLIEVLAQVKCQVLALSSIRGVLYKYMPKVKEAVKSPIRSHRKCH
jgi:pimeloyl-ACP methyl ester carboxylesterase